MDFILSTVAPLVVEYSIGPIARHVSYPFNYKHNVTSLEEGVEELKSARDRRQRWVNEHRRNGREIDEAVLDWLKRVGELIEKEEAELVLAKEKTRKKCCLGFCPNLKTRYQVSKKAEQKAAAVVSSSEENDTFSSTHYHTPALQCTGGFSSKDFETFESRRSILKDIMNALMNVDVNTIGVHGIGGVGKTTLATEVGRKAKEEELFDEVVMVTVTVDVDVINIQKTIADFLGLKFNEESKEGRAARLRERLKQEKKAKKEKILIILDDLWKKLKLEEVGIPQPDEHNGCKLLLTSRDLHVLSNEMGSQKDFPIRALAEDEAWDLFKKMADSNFDDPDLRCIAKDVAKVCAGLPIAIVTVASSLKSKNLFEWRNAFNELNAIPSEGLTEMQATVYRPVEFSYNKLESGELRSTFLLCCQMGYNATVRDLLKYGIGLGLFDVSTLENAQVKVYSLVQKLKTRCLLLEGNSNRQLVMHDLVRDVGRWIASSRDHGVIVLDERNNPKEWADEEKIKTYSRIWLYNNVDELQEELQCPNLDLIHIDCNDGDLQLPDNLFKGLDKLKVLSLTSFHFSSFPSSVSLLKNLKTLCFYDSSELGDIRIVGELKKLEVLSFAKSNITCLPTEIRELTKLKLLDLSGCYTLEKIPLNVLSKLSRLEELYMANSFDRWEIEGGDNASLTELKQLDSLSNLEIAIRDANLIPDGFFSKSLCRYRIFIGEGRWDWDCRTPNLGSNRDKEGETVKTLKLKLGANINMQNGVLQLLKETQDLYLHGVKNILCELDSEVFPKLSHLHLCDSPGVKYLIDMIESAPLVAFPMLETLTLENLVSLEKICQYRLRMQPFSELRYVEVKGCNKLTHLFSFFVAKGLSQLQEVKVSHCESMEEIVGEENKLAHTGKNEATKPIVFSQLHFLSLEFLPKLKSFCSKARQLRLSKKKSRLSKATSQQDLRTSITPLLNGQILFPNLKKLHLESIRCDTLWYGLLEAVGNSFQNLTELCVERCENMKYVFCYSLTKHLCQLKKLSLSHCEEMEEVIGMEEGSEEDEQSMNNKVVFPELLQLRLSNLRKLKRFCKGYLLECPLLKELKIVGCPDMKTFITREHQEMRLEEMDQNATPTPLFDDMVAFPRLVEMLIEGMHNMENIWHSQLALESFGELRKLSIRECGKLPKVFPSVLLGRFQKLEWLLVTGSKLVEEIFEVEGSNNHVIDSKLVEEIFEVEGSNNHAISFQLRDLLLRRLPKLKNVFPYSIATHLQKLERIEISNSGVEEIVAKTEMKGETTVFTPCFAFPELTNLRFESVPELRRWYPGMHTLMLPKLKHLEIPTDQMPLLLPGKVFCNLEELELRGDDFPANFRLENLGEDNWRGIPVSLLQEFHNLEKLTVKESAFEELFSFDGSVAADVVEDHYNCTERRLPRLKHLKLYFLHDMRYICEQQNHIFHLSPLFRSLETLQVHWCESLVSVAPSSTVSFQNLTSLILSHCNKLVNIVTTTTAKSLSNLVTLEASHCSMVTEIVEESEGEDEITFTKLQKLKLNHLQSLTSFCPGNYGFSFPCLNEVIVEECPKMKLFSPGRLLNTPKLLNVYFNEFRNKKRWEGHLNATIQQLHTEVPNSEDFHEIKNPSVTKDLSPDTITKHNEAEVTKITSTYYQHCQANIDHEEDPIQDRSLSTPMDIHSISQAQMDDSSTDQDKTIPPSSTEQSVNVCERPASDSCKDHFFKPVFKGLLPEHKMTQIPSTYQHSRAIAEYDQEDPALNQSSSTAMEMGNCFVSQEQVLSDAISTPYAASEPAIVSTSESKNRTLSSLELTSSLFSKPSSKPPSFPITEIESTNHATSSKKPPNITPSSFQPALSLITPAESCNSILETDGHSMSMHVMKNLLSKPLIEVVNSTDRVLLLSTLKNLRKCQCHLLNAQQIEAIQVFIENFDSFVAYHPFHENQIEQVGAFKFCVEDKKKGIAMLKNHYEDLAQKSTSLGADKEALIKRLREIEEEVDKIREDMEDVHAKIATDSGMLEEAYTFFLPELDREQKEAEAKVWTSNSQWAKMRSLFT